MADNASEVYYPNEVEYDTSEVEYNTSEVEYYPSEVYNASEVEYDIIEMKYDTSEMKCYPFLMDEEFIKCAESKLGSSGQTTNETGATSCCLYEFVDRINKSFDKFIADYLRADNVSITCNITQDNLTAPLAFNRTNSCAHEDSSGRVMVCNSTCVQEYLRSEINISSSIYKDCFMELKAGSIQFQYSAAIFILLIIMFGAVLNCSVLIVYCKQRSLWKPLNLYLVSTLLADTLVLIIVAPIHLTELLTEKWKFGELICKIYISSYYLFSTVILYLTTALSIERYHMVANCLQSHTADADRTKIRVLAVNLGVWILAILYSLQYYFTSYSDEVNGCIYNVQSLRIFFIYIVTTLLLTFVLPFSLILIFYTMTFFKITKRLVKSEYISSTVEIESRDKVGKIFLLIIAIYFVSHLPLNILSIVTLTKSEWTPWENYLQGEIIYTTFYCVRVFSFCSNSIIILSISLEIRTHVYNMFHLRNSVNSTTVKTPDTSIVDLSTTEC